MKHLNNYKNWKLNESCDGIFIENTDGDTCNAVFNGVCIKEVDFSNENVFPFVIIDEEIYTNNKEKQTHNDIKDEYDLHDTIRDRKYDIIEGRIYLDQKIISFWKLENIKGLDEVLKIVQTQYDVNLFDDEWRIDVCIASKNIQDGLMYKEISEKYFTYKSYESNVNDGNYIFALIPITDYISKYAKNLTVVDTKELKAIHLLGWEEKQELKKKGWGKGWGSDMTAWDGKNPLWWRMLKYQENKIHKI